MSKLACLVVGTGEYTTGYGLNSAKTDKSAGVIMLTLFELRKQGLVGDLHLAGVQGAKLPAIRAHMQRAIGEAYPGSAFDLSCSTYPADGATDPLAYRAGLAAMPRGSAVLIFTPDDTHFSIAMDAVAAGMHVLATKPITLTLSEQAALAAAAAAKGVLCCGEFHKRWDPFYGDARDRLRKLGDLSFFTAYMSQPKIQLDTFKAWAGKSSDISYYLNSHHVDYCEWVMQGRGRPLRVTAAAATGVAVVRLGRPCEDTISLTVNWENLPSRNVAIATFVASWVAPPADVHSQQCVGRGAAGARAPLTLPATDCAPHPPTPPFPLLLPGVFLPWRTRARPPWTSATAGFPPPRRPPAMPPPIPSL
jgi:D-galacturonate reductase